MYKAVLYAVLGMAPLGCLAQDVTVDYDRSAPFSDYKTYAWAPRSGTGQLGGFPAGFLDDRMKNAVDRNLAAKGLVKTDQQPDLYVTYYVSARERQNIHSFPYYVDPLFGPYWNDIMVTNYVEGTYVIDLIDARSNRLVWRTYAVEDKNKLSDLQNKKTVDDVVKEALKDYPPDEDD